MALSAAELLQPLFAAVMIIALSLAMGVAALSPSKGSALISAATASAALRRLTYWACWLLGIGLAAYGCVSTVAMTDTALMAFPAALWLVLTKSHFGTMLWLSLAAWIAMLLGTVVVPLPLRSPLFILGMVGFALARAATGHAADQGFFSFSVLIHMAHILGASVWLGSILVCVLLTPAWSKWSAPQRNALAQRLSEVATVALAVVVASGLYNVARTLGPAANIWIAEYTWILLAKLCAVAIAAGLGLRNRWYWLAQLDQSAHDQVNGAAGFRRILIAELFVLLIVVALAAKLGTTMPAQ
ncbi:CopD family protein [Glaciimonas immobilis]|uniref:Putative copper resistance protein D n=1 Tax=Glaciimonas immobilis TaxID=728004 RepID=A0A840RRU3_9BURK|nr:CopD family protein [Glaciimonas immobilis]KAF3999908.1 hypothetical protein HAV38_01645 [Glaciimonas immobilis]MBB5200403.1 putative copper resistance protein D [Glaciimonas immobilis]